MLYFSFAIMYILRKVNKPDQMFGVLCLFLTPFYIREAFCKMDSYRYLFKIITTKSLMDKFHQMYAAAPQVLWYIRSYHFETRHYSTYHNKQWHHHSYQTSVTTHSAAKKLKYSRWKDISTPFQRGCIDPSRLTKVMVNKYWEGDTGATYQKTNFRAMNEHDEQNVLTETIIISGHKRYFYVNDNRSFRLHWLWYIIAHITIIYAYPYRMYLAAITDELDADVVKQIWTDGPGTVSDTSSSARSNETPCQRRSMKSRCMFWLVMLIAFFVYTFGVGALVILMGLRATEEATIHKLYPDMCNYYYVLVCNEEVHDTEECFMDGAKCVSEHYPDCHISRSLFLEDDRCDEISECNALIYIADVYCSFNAIRNNILDWFLRRNTASV